MSNIINIIKEEFFNVNNKLFMNESTYFTSKNLYEEFQILEVSTLDQLTDGMQWIIHNNINGVIIGGTAVAHYLPSGRSLTPDIDLLVKNLNDTKEILDQQNIQYDNLTYDTGIVVDQFNIDFIDGMTKYGRAMVDLVFNTAESVVIGGVKFRMIAPELLTIMKHIVGREKDQDDYFLLLFSGILDKDKFEKYINILKPSMTSYHYESLMNDIMLIV